MHAPDLGICDGPASETKVTEAPVRCRYGATRPPTPHCGETEGPAGRAQRWLRALGSRQLQCKAGIKSCASQHACEHSKPSRALIG